MNHAIHYLGLHSGIQELLLLADGENIASLAEEVCRTIPLKKLAVVALNGTAVDLSPIAERYLPEEKIRVMEENELSAFRFCGENTAVCFDLCDRSVPTCFGAGFCVSAVAGTIRKGNADAFSIWERFRLCAEDICIVSHRDEKEPEVLTWKRNHESDTELSVILPMYKVAAYLPRCIDSLLAWDAPYVEYLFVDDGSPDECADIVRNYMDTDHRIRLISKPNGGCASARQLGLEHARGRYVGFVDPDDYIDEAMFCKLLRRAMTGSYEISYCGYKELYESTGTCAEIDDVLGEPYCDGTSDPELVRQLIAFRRVAIWRGIYSREMLRRHDIRFHTDLPRFDDLPFKVETFACAKSVVSVPEYLYYYRMQRPGQDVSADDERLFVHFDIFRHLDHFFGRISGKKRWDYLLLVKTHTHVWALSKLRPEFSLQYRRSVQEDLKKQTGLFQGILALIPFAGKRDILCFIFLYLNWNRLLKQQISKVYPR